jgi:hypothetical protein
MMHLLMLSFLEMVPLIAVAVCVRAALAGGIGLVPNRRTQAGLVGAAEGSAPPLALRHRDVGRHGCFGVRSLS